MKPGLSLAAFGRSKENARSPHIKAALAALAPLSAIALLFMAGCKTPESQTLLERENFHQEEMIDNLRDCLSQCRHENAALKHQLAAGGAVHPATESSTIVSPPPTSPPPTTLPPLEPPAIEPGTPAPPATTPSGSPPSSGNSSSDDSQPEQWVPPKPAAFEQPDQAPDDVSKPPRVTESSYQEDESRPVRIAMIRLLTNGHRFGGHGSAAYAAEGSLGDNGLQMAFAPRDAHNRPVAAEGSVAIVVIDPAMTGPEARIARWDFPAEELQAHHRQTLFGKAYRFDLLWPHAWPQHEELKLFVRLTTPGGERLETQQTIYVKLAEPANGSANVADADDADSPAPPDEPTAPPVRTELVSTRLPPISVAPPAAADMGQFEPDDPAPPETPEPSAVPPNAARSSSRHNGAIWQPYR